MNFRPSCLCFLTRCCPSFVVVHNCCVALQVSHCFSCSFRGLVYVFLLMSLFSLRMSRVFLVFPLYQCLIHFFFISPLFAFLSMLRCCVSSSCRNICSRAFLLVPCMLLPCVRFSRRLDRIWAEHFDHTFYFYFVCICPIDVIHYLF